LATCQSRRKKLRDDRLELLRWRVAARLGFKSVDSWIEATTERERSYMMALALLDGWGEEWQELASRLVNLMRTTAQHELKADDALTSEDVRRRWQWLDEPDNAPQEVDWDAAATAMRQRFTGMTT
jgi:hypothetical protein